MGEISSPEKLTPEHDLDDFECGNATLDDWLIKHAIKNQNNGASRTFVICQEGKVIGFYALATGSVERDVVPGNISRGMPEPIPVVVLGRLAIDKHYQHQGLGPALLKDGLLRTLSISHNAGVRALLVHAISDEAKHFYLKYGFQESPMESMTLLLSIKQIKQHLSA